MACGDQIGCFHEECQLAARCMVEFSRVGSRIAKQVAKWRRPFVEVTEPQKQYPKRMGTSGKSKGELIDNACRKHRAGLMRTCKPLQRKCHLRPVCGVLGACVLVHERTLARPDLIAALAEPITKKAAMLILEEIMPSLKRYNDRNNYRSQTLINAEILESK